MSINRERLQTLIDHHKSGAVGRKVFDMNETITDTSACAAGELPFAFPEDWKVDHQNIALINDSAGWPPSDVQNFLGLHYQQMCHLFYCNAQNIDEYGGVKLSGKTTREQWIAHAEEFMEKTR